MKAVDEVVIMDYYANCRTAGSTAALPCDPAYIYGWSMPYVSYAQWLFAAHGKKTLVSAAVEVDATPQHWGTSHIHTEYELEALLSRGEDLMRWCGMGRTGSCLGQPGWGAAEGGPFNHFALFESSNYENMTAYYPCPPEECTGPRVGKAAWMYDNTPLTDGAARQAAFLSWCAAHHVTELYVAATCPMLPGCERACVLHPSGSPPPRPNATTVKRLEGFILAAHEAGVDVQLYAGEVDGEPSLTCTAAALELAKRLAPKMEASATGARI